MCKQDIQIGRKLVSRRVAVPPNPGGVTQVLGPRADRVGIAVSVAPSLLQVAGEYVTVGGVISASVWPLLSLTSFLTSGYLHIRDYGPDVTQGIAIQDATAGGASVAVTEYYFNEELEQV